MMHPLSASFIDGKSIAEGPFVVLVQACPHPTPLNLSYSQETFHHFKHQLCSVADHRYLVLIGVLKGFPRTVYRYMHRT
jgi:hypothetical protein